jgi:hypothetical protein
MALPVVTCGPWGRPQGPHYGARGMGNASKIACRYKLFGKLQALARLLRPR